MNKPRTAIFSREFINQFNNVQTSDITNTPTGSLIQYAGDAAPQGWLLCDGSYVSIDQYTNLYNILTDIYGEVSEGSFRLPDLRGRVIIGSGSGDGLTSRSLAVTGGSETHTLSETELPSHTHTGTTVSNGSHAHTGTTVSNGSHTHTGTTSSNGSHTHSITDPSHSHSVPTAKDDGNSSNTAGQIPAGDANENVNFWYNSASSSTGISVNANGDHTHSFTTAGNGDHTHGFTTATNGDHTHTFTTNATGGASAHSIVQPFIVLHYIIKY